MAGDACAVDSASIDLVNRRAGRELFTELWKKDPMTQVREAARLGMGSPEYELADA